MKVPNAGTWVRATAVSLSRLQNEGSQLTLRHQLVIYKSIKATE